MAPPDHRKVRARSSRADFGANPKGAGGAVPIFVTARRNCVTPGSEERELVAWATMTDPEATRVEQDLADRVARLDAAALVASRYRLGVRLGAGASGEVWSAEDTLASEPVAIKILQPGAMEPARVRREIAVLRMLRIPGVVRLLDEGTHAGRPFLVMERAHGQPFPGANPPRPWAEIEAATVGVLETLARIHATGIVHRDLKPQNVLVEDGRPTVLDFGLSFGGALADGLTAEGRVLGTPAYLAPEQILGEPVRASADLYAVGVMLFKALSGRLPHEASDFQALMRARLMIRPPPLREVAPAVPSTVAEVVDALLARAPAERPASALETICRLRGQRTAPSAIARLPRLGADPVQALLEAVERGASIDVAGPPGSGRSRCLRDLAERIEAAGRSAVWALPGRRPFASLEPLVGATAARDDESLEAVIERIDAELGASLARGVVILADDAERIDRWSARALDGARVRGSIVRALAPDAAAPGALQLAPLAAEDLRPLFGGLDRLFHLPTDAARALHARTVGVPARVVDEIEEWVRAGLARWDGPKLIVDRTALDRLEAGLFVAPPASSAAGRPSLEPHLEDLLAWVHLTFPHADGATLAAATGQPRWQLEAELSELALVGAVQREAGGAVAPRARVRAEELWSDERRQAAHAAIASALPAGTEGRMAHLVASGVGDVAAAIDLGAEALALGRRLAEAGHLGRAVVALGDGVAALRRSGGGTEVATLRRSMLALWVEIALVDATSRALDRVLYEIGRAPPGDPELAHLDALVRASLASGSGGERALEVANAVAPFDDPALERRRQNVRALASRRCPVAEEEAMLAELSAWARASADPLARASLELWLGRLRYRQGRFVEAAEHYAASAAGERWVTLRANALLSQASSLLEAFALREAAASAREAGALAARCRQPYLEGRAAWILRATAYRLGEATSVDEELVDAVAAVGFIDLEKIVYFNEAAVAWRVGAAGRAMELAERARRTFAGIGDEWGALAVRCLAIAAGADAPHEERQELVTRAEACPVAGLGIQALGLLALGGPSFVRPAQAVVDRLAGTVPRAHWSSRIDVTSVDEALSSMPSS